MEYIVTYKTPQKWHIDTAHSLPEYGHITTSETHIRQSIYEKLKVVVNEDQITLYKAIHNVDLQNIYRPTTYEHIPFTVIENSFYLLCDLLFDEFNPKLESISIEIRANTNENSKSFFMAVIDGNSLSITETYGEYTLKHHAFGDAIDKYCNGFLLCKCNKYNKFE